MEIITQLQDLLSLLLLQEGHSEIVFHWAIWVGVREKKFTIQFVLNFLKAYITKNKTEDSQFYWLLPGFHMWFTEVSQGHDLVNNLDLSLWSKQRAVVRA